jgi:hypothetical protein
MLVNYEKNCEDMIILDIVAPVYKEIKEIYASA